MCQVEPVIKVWGQANNFIIKLDLSCKDMVLISWWPDNVILRFIRFIQILGLSSYDDLRIVFYGWTSFKGRLHWSDDPISRFS